MSSDEMEEDQIPRARWVVQCHTVAARTGNRCRKTGRIPDGVNVWYCRQHRGPTWFTPSTPGDAEEAAADAGSRSRSRSSGRPPADDTRDRLMQLETKVMGLDSGIQEIKSLLLLQQPQHDVDGLGDRGSRVSSGGTFTNVDLGVSRYPEPLDASDGRFWAEPRRF